MDVRAISAQFKALAYEPANREAMVTEHDCLPAIATFLGMDDVTAVENALETLILLTQHEPNIARMKQLEPLTPAVQRWNHGRRSQMGKTGGLAVRLSKVLGVPIPHSHRHNNSSNNNKKKLEGIVEGDENAPPSLRPSALPSLTVIDNTAGPFAVGSPLSKLPLSNQTAHYLQQSNMSTSSFFSSQTTPQKAKTIHIRIDELTPENAKQVEEGLLDTIGVISFTFDIANQRADVRAVCSNKELVDGLGSCGYTATIVGGDEDGLQGDITPKSSNAPSTPLPSYAAASPTPFTFNRAAITNNGDFSLAARERARQRRLEQQETLASSLINKVGSWLW